MKSAVLFIVFNRPDTTRQVFEAIRKAKPPRLYIAADGARPEKPGEKEKCEEVRRIATAIDWKCDVKTLFSENNLGCRLGVSTGINWFFENEEEGIILEDDCLPTQSYFIFCDKLLEKYRNDSRVWQICGTLFFKEKVSDIKGDYFFSKYGPIWGWATWKRAWKNYDVALEKWESMSEEILMRNVYANVYERKEKAVLGKKLYEGQIDTWDYQWGFIKNYNSGLSIVPKQNLIINIGFGNEATHTMSVNSDAPDKFGDINADIIHPDFIVSDYCYDICFSEKVFKKDHLLHKKIYNMLKTRFLK